MFTVDNFNDGGAVMETDISITAAGVEVSDRVSLEDALRRLVFGYPKPTIPAPKFIGRYRITLERLPNDRVPSVPANNAAIG